MHRETSCTVIRGRMAEDAVGFYGILGDEEATAYLSNVCIGRAQIGSTHPDGMCTR